MTLLLLDRVDRLRYAPGVDDLGARLRALRKRLDTTPTKMARLYLGERASAKAVATYVDKVSKLERGEKGHTNPSLERLEQLAGGCGLPLHLFLAELNRLQDSALNLSSEGRKDPSLNTIISAGGPHEGLVFPPLAVDPETAHAIARIAVAVIRAVSDSLADRPVSSPRPEESEGGEGGATRG